AENRIRLPVSYGHRAVAINECGGRIDVTLQAMGDAVSHVEARYVAIGVGLRPSIPAGIVCGPRVFHNHGLLRSLAQLGSPPAGRFLVVGSGQSGAEVAAYLHDAYPNAQVHISLRRFGFTPADSTPFANRIFDATSVDEFYDAPRQFKRRLVDTHRSTNYSAVDAELIEELYRREYDETVSGRRRLTVHRTTILDQIQEHPDRVSVALCSLATDETTQLDVDAVILATGFEPGDVRELLGPTIDHSSAYADGLPLVERDYSLKLPGLPGRVFLNGGVEHTHGLTSSLLSNVAVRSAEILRSIAMNDELRTPS
ncbi:MAG: SidA/IucD/PvdA family monooxygenase, partial [Microbacterium sp.]